LAAPDGPPTTNTFIPSCTGAANHRRIASTTLPSIAARGNRTSFFAAAAAADADAIAGFYSYIHPGDLTSFPQLIHLVEGLTLISRSKLATPLMLLGVLPLETAFRARLILGTPSNSYQATGQFSKLFASFPSCTLSGIVVEVSPELTPKLVDLEHHLLSVVSRLGREDKVACATIAKQIDSYARGGNGGPGWAASYVLVRIVGVWDTDDEYGLVCKIISAGSVSSGLAAGKADATDPLPRQPEGEPKEKDHQRTQGQPAAFGNQHTEYRIESLLDRLAMGGASGHSCGESRAHTPPCIANAAN
jgi:hypothetical protein